MLKVIFFSIFTCTALSVSAQVQTRVIGDSVFIHSNTGKGELILQNSTDSVNGFLFNKGGGRTEFRRALIKINDSTYLVGSDSLHLNNARSIGWGLAGNAGTNPSVNFIGTTDNHPLVFRVNGQQSGVINNDGNKNTSFGYRAIGNNGSTYNTAFGYQAISRATSGLANVAVGYQALNSALSTGYNTAVGSSSLLNDSTGAGWNTEVGYASGRACGSCSYNTGVGFMAQQALTTGIYNTGIGFKSMYNSTSAGLNTSVGIYSMYFNKTGIENTAVGDHSLFNTLSSFNTAIGDSSLYSNTTGLYNIGLGIKSGGTSPITSSNTFYISDSTYHMYYKLDSAAGIAPSIIGKDANGFWHVYQNSSTGGGTNIALTTTGTNGAATLSGNVLNIPEYNTPVATTSTIGVVSVGPGLVIDSAGKLATSTGLFKQGSVPYAGPAGTLIQDTTGLVYDGNNLQVGHSGFYNTTGLSLNGGRGYLGASGFGLTIKTNGGVPMDASKSISFYNSSTRYGVMSMRSVSDSTLRFLTDMEIVPSSNNKYNLGAPARQWDTVFTKQLYVNGSLVTGGVNASGTATLSNGNVTVSSNAIKIGAKIFVSVNIPGGTQGFLSAPSGSIVDGVSFMINSTSATDNSTVNWQIIN